MNTHDIMFVLILSVYVVGMALLRVRISVRAVDFRCSPGTSTSSPASTASMVTVSFQK